MALIYFLCFIGIITAIIGLWFWIDIFRHPEQV
jgi:hypothetical protein